MHAWPLTLQDVDLTVRPMQRRDRRALQELRRRNRDWLQPWDATDPYASGPAPSFPAQLRWTQCEGRAGRALVLLILLERRLVGQVSAAPIAYGAQRTAQIGYWVDHRVAGQGIAPRAAALLVDHLLDELSIHRVEVTVRAENAASIAVARKLGLRHEGTRRGAVHVDGAWRDHEVYALLAEDLNGSPGRGRVLARVHRLQRSSGGEQPSA